MLDVIDDENTDGTMRRLQLQAQLLLQRRIEKAFGVKMETLMRMQSSYDIACARARAKSIRVRPYEPQLSA